MSSKVMIGFVSGFLWVIGPQPALLAGQNAVIPKIDSAILAEMKRQQIPGLALAVVQKGEVRVLKGYGLANVEHAVPVTLDTIFQSGSVGKKFTAAAIMLLVEDGKLALEDPITKFYPDAPHHWHRISIRHLLTGTSGLPLDPDEATLDLRKDYTEDELIRMHFGLKLLFEPGTRWNYSNVAFEILGFLVHKVSGQFYGDFLRDRVFGPAGMKTTRIISEADIVPHRAAGYRLEKGELKNQEWVSPTWNSTADGSLQLSILDFLAWDKAVRARAVLKPGSWAQVFTPVKLISGRTYPYGFGWEVDEDVGQLRIQHGGTWQGFRAQITQFPKEELSILILVNQVNSSVETLVDRVAEIFNPKLVLSDEPVGVLDTGMADRIRTLLAKARDGKLAPEDWSVQYPQFSEAAAHLQKVLAPFGEPERFLLIRRMERGDDHITICQALLKDKKILEVYVAIAPDNKLSHFFVWEKKVS